ncbi:MAG: hypothetical protein PHW37_04270 [Acholeplasmataceae bacterium]|nr:hypothetical protein [Acholeplasmataceae bacterium]
MNRKQKKAMEALKVLGLNKYATKEEIIKKTDFLAKDNFEGNACKNYTSLSDIYASSQWLINHHDILKELPEPEVIPTFKTL